MSLVRRVTSGLMSMGRPSRCAQVGVPRAILAGLCAAKFQTKNLETVFISARSGGYDRGVTC